MISKGCQEGASMPTFTKDHWVSRGPPLATGEKFEAITREASHNQQLVHGINASRHKPRMLVDEFQIVLVSSVPRQCLTPHFGIYQHPLGRQDTHSSVFQIDSGTCGSDGGTDQPHDQRHADASRGLQDNARSGKDTIHLGINIPARKANTETDPAPIIRLKMRETVLARPKSQTW